jgi:hypothetical protein
VRFAGRTTDALLISFETAKVSIVEWDAQTHKLCVVSLHFYENDSKLCEGRIQWWRTPFKLVVDPTQHCAASVLYDHQLLVIPLSRATVRFSCTEEYVKVNIMTINKLKKQSVWSCEVLFVNYVHHHSTTSSLTLILTGFLI